jgi:hypothetical protein
MATLLRATTITSKLVLRAGHLSKLPTKLTREGKQMYTDITSASNPMIAALSTLISVDVVSHEYPDYYTIVLTDGTQIDLGEMDDNNGWGWNTQIGDEIGMTREKDPSNVALAFSKWLKNTYYRRCCRCKVHHTK